jgi:Ca2+:H+ antiporter
MIGTLRMLVPPPRWRPLLLFTALVMVPGGLDQLRSLGHPLLAFLCCGLGLLPLAVTLSDLVERLVAHLGPRLGGIASVVLGNLVELLVAFNALSGGLYPLVVTSIAGSVLINCLPVLGLGIVIAARGRPSVTIGDQSSELQNLQLLMSALLLALPSIFFGRPMNDVLQGSNSQDAFSVYSTAVAVLALGYYLLAFRLHQSAAELDERDPIDTAALATPLPAVIAALVLVSVVVALISERLVDALELLVSGAHLSELFVGLFLLPLFGCLPEMLITMRAAANRNMSLVMTNTVDSSLQLLLFVLPLLVLAGLPLGRHLHLALPPVALAALGVAVVTIDRVTDNREVNAYEGIQLILLFVAMALGALLLIRP